MTLRRAGRALGGVARHVRGSWFSLTPDEQRALALVLALVLLGMIMRHRHQMAGAQPVMPAGDARVTVSEGE